MDKVGANYHAAIATLRQKLPGANPIPIQWPVFVKQSAMSRRMTSVGNNNNNNNN
eukprot:CAMPEP_0168753262 /NCGR_PEP_ID=MMETSP0724-20121128/18837_1 /TAXON_ID=265536 /ORGANISM="Amphiprora sp., Strain CCMP467" /LENGTH=54 /DNA_ID=CAMNT_0008801589 /DNA_START=20 /DNA_END=181 /DNA_ORIENTATION=-